ESASAYPVAIASSAGNDAVNVNADGAGAAAVTFATPQKVGALTIGAGGSATLLSSGTSASNLLIVTSLSITGTGKLDVRDNDLAVDYTGTSAIGTWNGTSYGGITGLVAGGKIISSLANGSIIKVAIAEASQALGISGTQS